MHSVTISFDKKGWSEKFRSVMDSGSIGPLPAYCSMNRKKGEMKSAKTPSMSKPTFMETQFKQIGDEGQPRLLAARRECATEKIQPKVSTGREEREWKNKFWSKWIEK